MLGTQLQPQVSYELCAGDYVRQVNGKAAGRLGAGLGVCIMGNAHGESFDFVDRARRFAAPLAFLETTANRVTKKVNR